jgi:nucleoside-diphosphate-sugar epimerase
MKKILVTGAGGFIGYHLANYFTAKGHSVIGVDLKYPENAPNRHEQGFTPVISDFRNWEMMQKWLSDVDTVFHLAAAHLQIELNSELYWDINVHSIRPLLELLHNNGVQLFVHVSSVGIYGNLEKLPADEETLCRPQSIYGETKLAGEAEVLKFAEETGFPVVILRPAWVYGPGCPRTVKLYTALKKRQFVFIGNGNNLRHPIYIQDLLSAFELAMEAESAVSEEFIIGGNQAITIAELVDMFCTVLDLPKPKIKVPLRLGRMIASGSELVFKLAGKQPPFSSRSLEFFCTNNSFNISKAKDLLGFAPRYSFKNGLEETKAWLESHNSS